MGARTGRILVVDRDRRVRAALRTLAHAAGHEVVAEAADAPAARRAIAEQAPALAVVDPMLPTLSEGCALVRELSADGIASWRSRCAPPPGPPPGRPGPPRS
jgi:CheY-like chemotaxis protein